VSARRRRLRDANLYLVCDAQPDAFLHAVLDGGVDLVQLRMKEASDEEIIATARRFGGVCAQHGALLILNDRPDLVAEAEADGVHVGQDDVPVAEARSIVGSDRLVGLSTHTSAQIDAVTGVNGNSAQIDAVAGVNGNSAPDAGDESPFTAHVDYIGVGPVYATPTKPGRPAVGLALVRYAADHAAVPFFAIGGVAPTNVAAVRAAGARRVAVVRALTQAGDPHRAAVRLKQAVSRHPGQEVGVGPA
jgi:thiamine-phosphate pyrophosphorylase